MNQKYKCPHCGREIQEVSVIEMTWKRFLVSAGLGIGCGLLIYPLVKNDPIVSAVGAFIIGFIVVFLVWKPKPEEK